MKLTDGKQTVDVEIKHWNGTGYDPDWSQDYFGAGYLPYDEETEAYMVADVTECLLAAISKDPDVSAVMVCDENGEAILDPDMAVFVDGERIGVKAE